MGGMFAGMLSGFTESSREHTRGLMDIELAAREGIASMWESIASNESSPPEIRQAAMQNIMEIQTADPNKPLNKKLTNIDAVARLNPIAPTGQAAEMAGQTELPASVRGGEPPTPPQGLLNIPYGMGAPGGQPMGPSPAPEGGPPMDLPAPEAARDSLFYGPGQQTAMQMNELQQYIRAGLLPSGVTRDIQEPLRLTPGSEAYMRDPSGAPTGEVLRAPFAPDAGPELSAEDQIAVNAYAVRERIPIEEMGPEDYQAAIAEGKEMMRRPEDERLIPIITMDANNNPITAYRYESDIANKAFPRPSGAEGQAAAALDSAKQIYPRLKELSVGIKELGKWEGDGGIFTVEGAEALLTGAYKTMKAYVNLDLDLAEYNSAIQGFIPTFARAVGHTGVLTELDVMKTMRLFPQAGDSRALAIRKLKNVEMLMSGDKQLAPDWWDPTGLALRPPPNPALQGLTNEELLGFMER